MIDVGPSVYLVHEIETQQLDVLLDTVGLEVEPVVLVGEDEFVLSSERLDDLSHAGKDDSDLDGIDTHEGIIDEGIGGSQDP